MVEFLAKFSGATFEFLHREPILAIALGAALLALFLTFARQEGAAPPDPRSLPWHVWLRSGQAMRAAVAVAIAGMLFLGLRRHVNDTVDRFRFTHGRVTEVNLGAVRTIWGDEQVQGELSVDLAYETEEVERLEPEDPTMPAVLRKHTVEHHVEENPFVSAHHAVTLRSSPRTKGSAVYAGYEVDSHFSYALRNPSTRDVRATLRFPLPSSTAMYDGLTVTLDGASVLDRLTMDSGHIVLVRDLAPGQALTYEVAFRSRGLAHWYFQVREPREIRDFVLALALPDLPRAELNYPEGCMPPTDLADSPDGRGSLLTWKLDRAITSKGMGVVLPALPQPGETTSAVLGEAITGWALFFAALVLFLALGGARHALLLSLFGGAVTAIAFGLLADFSDLLWGFWPSAVVVLVPLHAVVGILVTRALPGRPGRAVAPALLVCGLVYPAVAGLDPARAALYLNVCGLLLLGLAGWLLVRRARAAAPSGEPGSPAPTEG